MRLLLRSMPMANLLEYVGSVHIFLGPYRGNPISLYLTRGQAGCEIASKVYPWNDVIGKGDTPNRAAADFEEKWKTKGLSPEMYSGPAWEGGIKPEKPAPPKPPAAPKPAATTAAAEGTETKPTTTAVKPEGAATPTPQNKPASPAAAKTGVLPAKPPAPATAPSAQPEPAAAESTSSEESSS